MYKCSPTSDRLGFPGQSRHSNSTEFARNPPRPPCPSVQIRPTPASVCPNPSNPCIRVIARICLLKAKKHILIVPGPERGRGGPGTVQNAGRIGPGAVKRRSISFRASETLLQKFAVNLVEIYRNLVESLKYPVVLRRDASPSSSSSRGSSPQRSRCIASTSCRLVCCLIKQSHFSFMFEHFCTSLMFV